MIMHKKLFRLVLIFSFMIILGYLLFLLLDKRTSSLSVWNNYNTPVDKYSNAIIEHVVFSAEPGLSGLERVSHKGILFRNPRARATILICHGFMCDKTDVQFLRMIFKDYNVMIFDFRAHGESKACEYCTFGCDEIHDIYAACRCIKSHPVIGKLPLIAYGFSMGAVASINAQSKDATLFDCAIWDCPFDSTHGVISRSVDELKISVFGCTFFMPGRAFLKKFAYNQYVQKLLKTMLKAIARMDSRSIRTRMLPFDTTEAAKKIAIPAFFIVCKNDKKAPPQGVEKIYQSVQGYKRLWITNGRNHFDSFFYNPEKYSYKVRQFIEKFLDGKFSFKKQNKITHDQ